MTCAELLDRYTDFRDGLISAPRELRRFQRHLAQCAACRRYDTAVRRGVLALRAATESIEPSPDTSAAEVDIFRASDGMLVADYEFGRHPEDVEMLKKLSNVGRDLEDYSLDTVKMFHNDAAQAGFVL